MKISSTSKRWLFATVVCLLITSICCYIYVRVLPLKPDGRYRDDLNGATGISFYDFSNGKVSLVVVDGERLSQGKMVYSNYYANYYKIGGQWVILNTNGLPWKGGESGILKAHLFSIEICDSDGTLEEKLPRMWW